MFRVKFFGVILKFFGVIIVAAFAVACTPSNLMAQSGEGIPVMVLGEDSDRDSIPRSSDIFRRVLNELKQQMSRYNFYVIDEEMMAADFGWQVRDRRPKSELVKVVDLANQSGNFAYQTRAMVIFKIRAAQRDLGFAKEAFVRVTGEIYDVEARRFIDSFEVPRMDFPITKELTEDVGDHARDIAAALGDTLRKKLAFASRGAATSNVGTESGASSTGGLVSTYSFTFRNFSTREVYTMIDVMEEEFPGFKSARSPEGSSAAFKYGYVTTAKGDKLHRWINIMLMDMGLDPDTQVSLTKRGNEYEIDKLFDNNQGNAPADPNCKFC